MKTLSDVIVPVLLVCCLPNILSFMLGIGLATVRLQRRGGVGSVAAGDKPAARYALDK